MWALGSRSGGSSLIQNRHRPPDFRNAKNQQGHIRHWLHPAASVLTGECLAGNAEVNLFCAQKTEACKVKKGKVKERR